MSDSGPYDYYDELNTCSVCGDRYCDDDLCWSCREQEMIDKTLPPDTGIVDCLNCYHWNDVQNTNCVNCGFPLIEEIAKNE